MPKAIVLVSTALPPTKSSTFAWQRTGFSTDQSGGDLTSKASGISNWPQVVAIDKIQFADKLKPNPNLTRINFEG